MHVSIFLPATAFPSFNKVRNMNTPDITKQNSHTAESSQIRSSSRLASSPLCILTGIVAAYLLPAAIPTDRGSHIPAHLDLLHPPHSLIPPHLSSTSIVRTGGGVLRDLEPPCQGWGPLRGWGGGGQKCEEGHCGVGSVRSLMRGWM
eukprot:766683-Hanusia_phi.AAC.1